MGAVALTLTWRRITRSNTSYARRWVCFVDAMALLYAARKRRSSSPAFRVQLQKTAALLMCADIAATYAYVPTSCNPGDPPSRGLRRNMDIFVRFRQLRVRARSELVGFVKLFGIFANLQLTACRSR